jgi:hypothetical protein
MKTLTSTLLASQKKANHLPYIEAKVYDYEAGIKRLSWTRIYEGSEPDNHHGIAFDGQGSMHRIRNQGNNLYYQKQTLPFGVPSSFPLIFPISLVDGPALDQWTLIAEDCYGPCAIAASPAEAPPAQAGKVYIFYKPNEPNKLNKLYSHDYGQSWNNAQLAAYDEVVSLAACWWGTGNNVVCFALKGSYPAKINGIVLDTSDQSTSQHEWYDATHPLLDTYGIGATFNPFWPAIEIIFAGKESDIPYNHYDLFRTKFSSSYNFLALESFIMVPDGEGITYEYPDCHLPAVASGEGGPDYETNRIIAVEKFVGTTAYTRPITCHVVKGTYWSDTTFTEPKPFLPDVAFGEGGPPYGLRLQSTADYWGLSKPDGVWRAPRPALPAIVLTSAGDIISLSLRGAERRGNLVLELNNSRGQYVNPGSGVLASLRFRSEVVLKLGYKTSVGNEAVEVGTYWIDSWEYSSEANVSSFTLHCLDGWGLMNRWSARYQMRWNKDEVNPKSVWQILYQLLTRVGIKLTNTPSKPQSSAINNFYPDFTVNPGMPGDTTIRRLLSFVPDQLVFCGQEAFTKNPLPAEAPSYSYVAPAIASASAGHPIISGRYQDAVTGSRARAIGRDADANRIVRDAFDWDLLKLSIDEVEQVYDPNLQTATRAQERADALLREASLRAECGNLVVPTNIGQELLDVVTVTDARCGVDQEKYRVQGIRTLYDRRQRRYEQALTLGAP